MAAIACELNLGLCHFDVQHAFVLAEFEEVVHGCLKDVEHCLRK